MKLAVEPDPTEIEVGLNVPPVPDDTETMNVSFPPLEHAPTNEISEASKNPAQCLGVTKVIEARRQSVKIPT